jgi:hypothetical protein
VWKLGLDVVVGIGYESRDSVTYPATGSATGTATARGIS